MITFIRELPAYLIDRPALLALAVAAGVVLTVFGALVCRKDESA